VVLSRLWCHRAPARRLEDQLRQVLQECVHRNASRRAPPVESGIYTYDERVPTESDITDAELIMSAKLNLIATFGRR